MTESRTPQEQKKRFGPPPHPARKNPIPEPVFNFEIPPAPIPDIDIKETINTDVLVVGAGISGAGAALSAVEKGAKVILIEKANSYTATGADNGFIGSRLQKKLGIEIDPDEVVNNLVKFAANIPNQRLLRMWAYHSGETADWLMDMTDTAGLNVRMSQYPFPDEYDNKIENYPQYMVTHHYDNERAVVKCIIDRGIQLGMTVTYRTRAKQLLREYKGRVTGLVAQNEEGSYIRYLAQKGVILCTGDYGNNNEMVAKYCPRAMAFGTTLITATGDGHQMAMWAGAVMEPGPHPPMIHSLAGPLGSGAFLQVNARGERFQNEDVPCELYVIAVERQPNKFAWQVFDSKYPNEVDNMGLGIGRGLFPAEEMRESIEAQSLKADTIEDLAVKMNVPVDTFKTTVDRYNELVKLGKDMDFGKRRGRMTYVNHPPYYAGKGSYWFMCCMGGLNVNNRLEALDTDYEPIPGLYLGGNIVGNRYGVNYPSMCPGISNGMALFLGRVAGQNAAFS